MGEGSGDHRLLSLTDKCSSGIPSSEVTDVLMPSSQVARCLLSFWEISTSSINHVLLSIMILIQSENVPGQFRIYPRIGMFRTRVLGTGTSPEATFVAKAVVAFGLLLPLVPAKLAKELIRW